MDIIFGLLDQLTNVVDVASGNVRSQIDSVISPFCKTKNTIEWGFIIVTGLVILSCVGLVYILNENKTCGKTSLVLPTTFDMVKNKQFGILSRVDASGLASGYKFEINNAFIALSAIAATIVAMMYAAYLMPMVNKPIAICNGYHNISNEIDKRIDQIPQYVNLLTAFAKSSTSSVVNSAASNLRI